MITRSVRLTNDNLLGAIANIQGVIELNDDKATAIDTPAFYIFR